MSRQLPARPNLDHLKSQAKALLGDLKRQRPDAQLADALHQLARDYGHESWPRLKAHVESLLPPEPASPLAGAWLADVGRSRMHAANPFRSARMHFDVTAALVTVRSEFVDAGGRTERHTVTIVVDGAPHATPNGYELTARWLGTSVLEMTARKEGAVVGHGRYEVSEDGTTLTVVSDDARIVCVRPPVARQPD